MIPNAYFDADMLEVLAAPDKWRWVLPFGQKTVSPLRRPSPKRVCWSQQHAHSHRHAEFMLALRGGGRYGVGKHLYPCVPGTAFFFAPDIPHDDGYQPNEEDAAHLWISVLRHCFVTFTVSLRKGRRLNGARQLLMPESVGLSPSVLSQIEQPAEVSPAIAPYLRCRAVLQIVVAKIVEQGFHSEDAVSDLEQLHQKTIIAVQQHIRDTTGKGLTLEHLALLAGYSKYHFARLFKHYTGQTTLDFINQCRCEKVREMLAQRCSHKKIGAALGFSCPATFSRWLHKQNL